MTPLSRAWPGLVLLASVGWIYYKDIPDKFGETPYLGWLYVLLVAGCAAAGAWLLSSFWRAGYVLGAVISLGAVLGYVLTRSVGLPGARGDIGHWGEPLGVLSLILETAFVLLALSRLRRPTVPVRVGATPGDPISSIDGRGD